MGSKLDDYFVSIGVKGQQVVLKTIDQITKKSKALSKIKPTLNLDKLANNLKSIKSHIAGMSKIASTTTIPEEEKREDRKRKKDQDESNKKFGQSVNNFARYASSLDPVNFTQGIISAIGKSASDISFLGFSAGKAPEGVADLTNSAISMMTGSLLTGRFAANANYALERRNRATAYYGGNKVNQGYMSNQEKADLVSVISGSMGKLQGPLIEAINELTKTKDTEALARVAGGNWESLGTDKGWFLQQISSQISGLPPSIKQKFQAALLGRYGDEIQAQSEKQKRLQYAAGRFATTEEQNINKLAENAGLNDWSKKSGEMLDSLIGLTEGLNKVQRGLVSSGQNMTWALSLMISSIREAANRMAEFNKGRGNK